MQDDRLLKIEEVLNMIGVKKSKLYNMINKGEFPKGSALGARTVRWSYIQVQDFIKKQIAKRPIKHTKTAQVSAYKLLKTRI